MFFSELGLGWMIVQWPTFSYIIYYNLGIIFWTLEYYLTMGRWVIS